MDLCLRRDPKYQSFVTVFRGFQYVGKQLEPYTRNGLQRVHQAAYRVNAGMPQCLQQCSRLHGNNIRRWCPTCTAWKDTLTNTQRPDRHRQLTRWNNTESWNWLNNYETIAPVYLPTSWSGDINLTDLSTACHLWSSCHEYNIDRQLLRKVIEFRNKHFAHNPDLKVTKAEQMKVFNSLKTLLHENDLQKCINVGECMQDLDKIANGDELSAFMDAVDAGLENNTQAMSTVAASQQILAECVNVWNARLDRELHHQRGTLDTIKHTLDKLHTLIWCILGILIVVIVVVLGGPYLKHQAYIGSFTYLRSTECLSEMYSHPFPQDLPLLPYLKEHSKLIGRKWLLDEIKGYVGHTNSTERGVIITADMGYGKSAIVKHLLCASTDDDIAYKIRSKAFAFHVCRFDVPATRDPQRFIYRLVGFLSTHFPEYGGLLSELPETALLYDENKCRKNIIACFDQGISHPLLAMQTTGDGPHLIIIDALDECFDQQRNVNDVYQLLKTRHHTFPKWLKLIVTSRETYMPDNIQDFKQYYLDTHDHRNVADVKKFIEYKLDLYPTLGTVMKRRLDKVVNQAEGNFLFVFHLIEYIISYNKTSTGTIPESLTGIYKMNFDRRFQSNEEYKAAKPILELLIAALHPLRQNDVETILERINTSKKEHTKWVFEKLSFFFRRSKDITFVHQSLSVWLLSKENILYGVSANQGHILFSKYLLYKTKHTYIDIVDVAIHIASTNDSNMVKAFSAYFSSKHVTNSTLHKLIWRSDSVAALELILKLQGDVDTLTDGGVTPAFVAAARGHSGQLDLLYTRGADMNFRASDARFYHLEMCNISSTDIEEVNNLNTYENGLIHIAIKLGHFNVVRFLLNQNKTLLNTRNGLGHSLMEIACENGHVSILELMLKYKSDVGNCLYYAANHDHLHIITLLSNVGANLSCVSMEDATNALEKLTIKTDTINKLQINDTYECFHALDLVWMVNQESPLHASIRLGYTQTAVTLIHSYPHLTECVDAFGITPFLLSVILNRAQVFESLIERVNKDRCGNGSAIGHVYVDEKRPLCPVGASFVHLDAIYGRSSMRELLESKGVDTDWLAKDNRSLSAVHYASCNGNVQLLKFVTKQTIHAMAHIRSKNQSTPFHSAAICSSLDAMRVLTDSFTLIPSVFDNKNRGILHYVAMRLFTGKPALNDRTTQNTSLALFNEILKSEIRFEHVDVYKRNILHYALLNGHFLIVLHLKNNMKSVFMDFLTQRDTAGNTPVMYASKRAVSWDPGAHTEPSNCSFYDIFSENNVEYDLVKYLSSWELAIVYALQTNRSLVADDFNKLMKQVILKSPYLTSAALVYTNYQDNYEHLKKQFTESLTKSTPFYSVYALARHIPKLFRNCGKPFLESPFHFMAYTYDMDALMVDVSFLMLVFGDPINTDSLGCVDRRGYNGFHYALMGGNIRMAISLYKIGLPIANNKVSIKDIPWMLLLAKKRPIVMANDVCSHQLVCMDRLLLAIFRKYRDVFVFADFCKNNSASLSLVHVVAASGMKNSMKFLYQNYGRNVIACINKDMITPQYLWAMFRGNTSTSEDFELGLFKPFEPIISGQRNVVGGLLRQSYDKHRPFTETEEMLIIGILNDFPFRQFGRTKFKCLSHKNTYFKVKMSSCINRIDPYITSHWISDAVKLGLSIMTHGKDVLTRTIFNYHRITTIDTSLQHIRFLLPIYYKLSGQAFNYPCLKKYFLKTFHEIRCNQNGPFTRHCSCFQIYIEYTSALNKIIEHVSKDMITEYVCQFARINMFLNKYRYFSYEYLNLNMIKYNHPEWCDNISIALDIEKLYRYHYLSILRKTVTYQYMKPTNVIYRGLGTRAQTISIRNPFEELLHYVNTSLHYHNLQ